MTQRTVFTNDAQTLQLPIAAATLGLDWARVAQEAGCAQPNRVLTHPFEPVNNTCSAMPEVQHPQGQHPQGQHKEVGAAVSSAPEATPHHDGILRDFSTKGYLMNDGWFGVARNATYAASWVAKGKLVDKSPFGKWSGLGALVTAELADDGLDDYLFKGVKRGKPSTFTDLAANGILFLPQSGVIKAAEMIGLHVVGKEIEKHYS